MKIELDKSTQGKWFFRIKAANGKVLAHSEEYARKRNAAHGAQLIADETGLEIVEVA